MAAWRPLHLVVLWAAVSQSAASSVDLEQATIYNGTGPREDFFGYKAYLFQSGAEKGIVVSAPLQNNGTGGIFVCDNSLDCEPVLQPAQPTTTTEDFIKAVGMSVAVRTKPTLQFTACSPAWSHECDGTPYFNSICYQWNKNRTVSNFTSDFKECTKQEVDLVFIFDGSRSMKTEDFNKNKDFIESIMKSMQNTSIQFAAVQFAQEVRTVFTFKDFQEQRAVEKLKAEIHMKSLTNTHSAMRFTLKELFNNSASGRQPKATKVVVIITDGNPSDFAFAEGKDIIKVYKDEHIIRFVIAVGNEVRMENLHALASEPKESYTFKLEEYSGLTGVLTDLETKIFNIEGSKNDSGQTRDFEKELSQSGMSAVYAKNSLILGSVGSNNWKGSLYQLEDKNSIELEIQDPQMETYSYMGYAVAVGKKNDIPFYFTGAPRYKHKGQVIVFSKIKSNWTVTQRVDSEQTGSYFGGELCAVDIDSDGTTDFLMVGAPLYYQHQIEGRMYVYALTGENKLVKMQNMSESRQGRFSSSIASLRDLNGDELQDLAVGAPLEDDRRGVVYIYLGDKTKGIRSNYYQRIRAKTLSESLQQFGVTIDGTSETDGLTDIAVGAYGQVVLLRTRPVFSVSAHLSVSPLEISIQQLDCLKQKEVLPMVNLTVCFKMSEQTKSTKDPMGTGLKLDYDLTVDLERGRGFFAANDSSLKRIRPRVHLNKPNTCRKYNLYMPDCVKDTLAPVIIKINFSQADNHQPYGVLHAETNKAMMKVPFQRSCKVNDTCVSDLQMDFDFTSSEMVVFGAQDNLFLKLALSNAGNDSYNTSLLFQYPRGMSYSNLNDIEKRTLTNCDGNEDTTEFTRCDVSPPIFRSKKSVIFNVSFHIEASLKWSDFITITIIAHSDNGDPGNGTIGSTFKDYPVTKSLPVVFAVGLAVRFWDAPGASTTYVNYSLEDKGPKTLNHIYRVENTGRVPLPVTASFIFPTKPEDNFEITHPSISHNKGNGTINCTHPSSIITQNCSKNEHCLRIDCHIPTLERSASVLFTLTVNAALSLSPNEYTFSEMRFPRTFKSSAEIIYNRTRYKEIGHEPCDQKHSHFPCKQGKTTAEYIVPVHLPMITGIASFGGLLLLILIFVLLYKCGFFKRKTFEDEGCEEEQDGQIQQAQPLMNEGPKENGSSLVDDSTVSADMETTDANCEE